MSRRLLLHICEFRHQQKNKNDYFTDIEPSLETWIDELETSVSEKEELEYNDISILLVIFATF